MHNIKFNRKFFNFIQNSNHKFTAIIEEVNVIRALEFVWPLLHAKNIMPAKFLVIPDTIKTNFPHGFFSDPESS